MIKKTLLILTILMPGLIYADSTLKAMYVDGANAICFQSNTSNLSCIPSPNSICGFKKNNVWINATDINEDSIPCELPAYENLK